MHDLLGQCSGSRGLGTMFMLSPGHKVLRNRVLRGRQTESYEGGKVLRSRVLRAPNFSSQGYFALLCLLVFIIVRFVTTLQTKANQLTSFRLSFFFPLLTSACQSQLRAQGWGLRCWKVVLCRAPKYEHQVDGCH